jgi:hypothetical protein
MACVLLCSAVTPRWAAHTIAVFVIRMHPVVHCRFTFALPVVYRAGNKLSRAHNSGFCHSDASRGALPIHIRIAGRRAGNTAPLPSPQATGRSAGCVSSIASALNRAGRGLRLKRRLDLHQPAVNCKCQLILHLLAVLGGNRKCGCVRVLYLEQRAVAPCACHCSHRQ